MFVESIDNIELFNHDLGGAKQSVICLYVHDIPPLRRRALLAKIEQLLLSHRNFIPGSLEYTLTMYYEQTVDELSKIGASDSPNQEINFLLLVYNDIEDIFRCCAVQEDPDRERWRRVRERKAEVVLSRCRDFPIFCSSKFVPNHIEIAQDHVLVNLTRLDPNQDGIQTQAPRVHEEDRIKASIKRMQNLCDKLRDEDLPNLHALHNQVVNCVDRIQRLLEELA